MLASPAQFIAPPPGLAVIAPEKLPPLHCPAEVPFVTDIPGGSVSINGSISVATAVLGLLTVIVS
jgi:hypothetical protein